MDAKTNTLLLSLRSANLLSDNEIQTVEMLARDTCHHSAPADVFAQTLEHALPFRVPVIRLILSITQNNYEILEHLGEGSMGFVFKVLNHSYMPSRLEALKAVKPDRLVQSSTLSHRFVREMTLLQGIANPNVISLYYCNLNDAATPFFTMEYLQGENLDDLVKRTGPLDLPKALAYSIDAAKGIQELHSHNIVHRDIKPSNLFLDSSTNTVRVLDLGLAHRIAFDDQPLDSTPDITITRSFVGLGTCHYMAPEQDLDAHLATNLADIYSLGCTLHFLLTTKTPYPGSTKQEIRLAHATGPLASLQAYNSSIPSVLDDIFRRMIARSPSDRFRNIKHVMRELEKQLEGTAHAP